MIAPDTVHGTTKAGTVEVQLRDPVAYSDVTVERYRLMCHSSSPAALIFRTISAVPRDSAI